MSKPKNPSPCPACNEPRADVVGCKQTLPWPQVPFPGWPAYGCEPVDDEEARCRCGAKPGELHHNLCDMEECGRCGHQSISCGCLEILGRLSALTEAFIEVQPNAGVVINLQREDGHTIPWPPEGRAIAKPE